MNKLWIPALVAAAGCASKDTVTTDAQEVAALPALSNKNLDLLFVIDNSPSTADKQAALAANFPLMMDALSSLEGGLPDVHIGVVTSDMGATGMNGMTGTAVGTSGNGGCIGSGDDGVLHGAPELSASYIVNVADPVTGERLANYDTAALSLGDIFSKIALVGAGGCGFEQHLAAMQRSFVNDANAGFLRDDANLAIIILADEDDCSMTDPGLIWQDTSALGPLQSFRCFQHGVVCDNDDPLTVGPKTGCVPRADDGFMPDVQPFIDTVLALKRDPRQIMVAAIAGDIEPVEVELRAPVGGGTPIPSLAHSCSSMGDPSPGNPTGISVADPAVRLAAFVTDDAFTDRSTFQTICTNDFSGPVGNIAQTARRLVGDPCFSTDGLLDADPAAAGVQPACEVTDVRDDDATTVPACGAGGGDCFELVADAAVCPATPDHMRVKLHRAADATADTWTHVRCQVAH